MGKLAKRREEIYVTTVDGRDKLDCHPLIVIQRRFGLVQWVAHDDSIKNRRGIPKVVRKPQVGLSNITAQHVYALELLHASVDLEIRAIEQLMHHTASLSPFFFLLYDCALVIAHKITRDGHLRSLVGNFLTLGYELRDDAVRVEHNSSLESNMKSHYFTIRYQGE